MKRYKILFVALLATFAIVATSVVAIAHSKSTGNLVVGASNKVEMSAEHDGDVRWILPGLRELDPAIFGTPDTPLRTELLDLALRAVTSDGKYVAGKDGAPTPTPFSNNWAPISGSAKVKVKDVTAVSAPTTKDTIKAEFEFTSPDGENSYRLVVKQAISEIDHENFGGVGINALQHGATGIGTPLMPQLMAGIAFWGAGDLWVNGEKQDDKRFVHFMLTNDVRDENYNLVFDAGVNPDGPWQAHLILPPMALGADGAFPSPVPTQFELPNGAIQPFLHIMFEDVRTSG